MILLCVTCGYQTVLKMILQAVPKLVLCHGFSFPRPVAAGRGRCPSGAACSRAGHIQQQPLLLEGARQRQRKNQSWGRGKKNKRQRDCTIAFKAV